MSMAEDSNGEQTSSEQPQRQFIITGGPTNVSFPPMQPFHFLPSQTHAVPVNYGEGFENDPNISSSQQLEAQRKLLKYQIEVCSSLFLLYPHTVSGMFHLGFT